MTNQTPKPFAERIEEMAEKRSREHSRPSDYGLFHEIKIAFEAGAQAALSLLVEPQAGHPPRVWAVVDKVKNRIIANFGTWGSIHGDPEEYVSLSEHQASRAADLLEADRLNFELESRKHSYNDLHAYMEDKNKQLSQEREARKADAAEIEENQETFRILDATTKSMGEQIIAERERNAKLTAALEEIANRGGLPWQPHALHCIAREALGGTEKKDPPARGYCDTCGLPLQGNVYAGPPCRCSSPQE